MVAKIAVVLCGLVACGFGQMDVDLGDIIKPGSTFDITDNVQDLLPQMNEMVESKNMAVVNLPDVKCRKKSDSIFSGVKFEGLDKMTSALKGQATVLGPQSLRVSTTIVFEDVKLSADKSLKTGTDLSWEIGSLTLNLTLSLLPKKSQPDQCFTMFNRMRIVSLDNVVQSSSNAEFNDKVPEKETVDKVVRFYNQFLRSSKALKRLGSVLDLCGPPSVTLFEAISDAAKEAQPTSSS